MSKPVASERIRSRLPDVGTTIFTVMSQAALANGAINLSQGFPSFEPPDRLLDLVTRHLRSGHNQYAPMTGVPALREVLAREVLRTQGAIVDPDSEITITAGATEGLFSAIQAVLHPGDEAIVLDPSYDAYAPAIRLAGGRPVHIPLRVSNAGEFSLDWQRLEDAMGPGTRLIVINFPHNPSGALLDDADHRRLASLLDGTDALLIADEVYEHIVFDGRQHRSVLCNDELRTRALVVSSFGKSLHATGWKIGYCIAPPALTDELRKIHQFTNFSVSTPMQYAIADYLTEVPDFAARLSAFYEARRDVFLDALHGSRFSWVPARSTFFQILDYAAISDDDDTAVAMHWTRTPGVASIPVSPFCSDGLNARLLRFCFAKDDDTLIDAGRRLAAL